MPKIIGYGEDALTYWALTKKLKYVLNELSDNSMPKNCVLYYRPSFGRGGGGCFGEFDSILQTDNWLYLIEAVHSSGPISELRLIQLQKLTKDCSADIVYVTAFLDRTKFRQFMTDIAWETEVWIADNPDHLVHFNGDKFLGPYKEEK